MGKLKSVEELFEGRHFDREAIILCVRWYLRFKLSLRDLVEMMAGVPASRCQADFRARAFSPKSLAQRSISGTPIAGVPNW
jgi:hypothetical protein